MMLKLLPGEYQGAVRSTVSADGLLVGVTEYVRDQSASFMHTHENAHLSLGLTGQMAVSRKSLSGIRSNVERFSFVHAGEEHQTILLSTTGKNINLELEQDFFVRYELTDADFIQLTETPGATLLMLKLFKELHFPGGAFTDNIHALILGMLQPQMTLKKKSSPSWVQVVRDLLSDNWNKELSLEQIALAADLHPVTVSKYFMRFFGCSLGEYRRRLKVERALELMNSSCKSLTDIAYACAFYDQSHFIRAFKEATGYSPKHFLPRTTR